MPWFTPADLGAGHRVAIWSEQGVGDQLVYSTLLPELESRGQDFVVEIDPRLEAAFARAHPKWKLVAKPSADAFSKCDRQLALGSLAELLRPDLASFIRQPRALLAADRERAAAFRRELKAPRVIGISWKSFQPKVRGKLVRGKSAPLAAFAALSRREGIELVDLQYGDTREEREAFAQAGGRLTRLEGLDLFNDLDGVLAAVEACDLVITTSNVTAHFAGAIGKRALLVYLRAMSPFHYWVPGPDGRALWYPSVEVISTPALDTWDRALARADELLDA
jgi:ADP-heptose:LPS heptosyltransferase